MGEFLREEQIDRLRNRSTAPEPSIDIDGAIAVRVPEQEEEPQSRTEELFSERAGEELTQIGYDTFRAQGMVLLNQAGGIQDGYVLGAGDEVVIALRGQENAEYRRRVDRSGQILLPGLGPVSASGRSLADFRSDLQALVAKTFIATDAFVSVGEIRQLRVLVSGNVAQPGPQIMTGLSTVTDALLLAGGARKSGSLRRVQIVRGDRKLDIDLYRVLFGVSGDPIRHLQEGDTVIVPPLGDTVAVVGAVRRPGIYETAPRGRQRADQLLDFAGGVEIRGTYRYSVLKTRADGVREFSDVTNLSATTLADGDILFVYRTVDEAVGQVTLGGHARSPGTFSLSQTRQLQGLISGPAIFDAAPYLLFGVVSRRDPATFSRQLMAFSPIRMIRNEGRFQLREDDIVWILGEADARALAAEARNMEIETSVRDRERFIEEQRAVRANAGTTDAISSRIRLESTQQRSASRRERDSLSGTDESIDALPPEDVDPRSLALLSGSRNASRRERIPAERDVRQRRERSLDREREVTEDDLKEAEEEEFGIPDLAEELKVDGDALAVFLTEYLSTVRGAVRVPGDYLIAPGSRLDDLASAAGGLKRTADLASVEITATTYDAERGRSQTIRQNVALTNGDLSRVSIEPHDSVVFRDVFSDRSAGRVSIFGEVRFPGTFEIVRGETLAALLERAGGLTDQAFAFGAIFSRRSVARIEREANVRKAEDLQNLIIAQTSRRSLNEEQIRFLSSIVQALRESEPIGRIAVEVDPGVLAARPELDTNLEPGDALYIPARPTTVTVTGQVLNPGSFQYVPKKKVKHYLRLAGDVARLADEGSAYAIYPDGTSERLKLGLWVLRPTRIIPGTVIVVPYDVTPFFLSDFIRDSIRITSQLAITGASVAAVLQD